MIDDITRTLKDYQNDDSKRDLLMQIFSVRSHVSTRNFPKVDLGAPKIETLLLNGPSFSSERNDLHFFSSIRELKRTAFSCSNRP